MGNFCRDLCDGIIGNCRNCMTAPITRTKIYWFTGILLVIIVIIIIICVSVPSGGSNAQGKDALSKGITSGSYLLAPGTSENTKVEAFDKKYFEGLGKNKIRFQVIGANADCKAQHKDAAALALDQVEFLGRLIQNVSTFSLYESSDDFQKAYDYGRVSAVISLVGGHSLDSRLALLRLYHMLGVRIMTVVADGCSTPWGKAANDKNNGTVKLGDFGKAVIKEMNRLGILIDIAGADADTQKAILETSVAPVAAIGVGLKSINQNPLNLDSNGIVPLFEKNGGVLMLSTDCALISLNPSNCTIDDFTNHLKTAQSQNTVVGIGGALNSSAVSPKELGPDNLDNYFNALYASGYKMDFLKGLAMENFLNTLRKVESKAKELQSKGEPVGESFFNWSELSDADRTCYTYTAPQPSPTTPPTPAPQPTSPTSTKP